MKKIIGLSSQYNRFETRNILGINSTYIRAVERAGAIPIIIPILEKQEDLDKYMNIIDGLILTGGVDISPLMYGEDPLKYTSEICVERDKMELGLFDMAIKNSIPVLGICRGLQVINVALGGSLYQDIPNQIKDAHGHVSPSTMGYGYHEIELSQEGYLYKIFNKDKIRVNSLHHQSIKELGENLKVVAKSNDGVIEAIESTDEKVYAVQFHPEALIDNRPEFLHVFEYFIGKL